MLERMTPHAQRIAIALRRLGEEQMLAFVTARAPEYVAAALASCIDDDGALPERWGAAALGEWLIDHPDVADVHVDDEALHAAYLEAFADARVTASVAAGAVEPDEVVEAPLDPRDAITLVHDWFGTMVYLTEQRAFRGEISDARHGAIEVSIDPFSDQPRPLPSIDALMPAIVRALDAAAEHARAALARWDAVQAAAGEQLLDTYNVTWRCYEQDGVEVDRPVLDASAFASQLRLSSLTIRLPTRGGEPMSSAMWIEAGDLFWGHALLAELYDATIRIDLVG
jgi:hypothetical protein